jgi:hypothetical protein
VPAAPAAAHIGLHHPPSRYGDHVLKTGPCGIAGGARSDNVTVLEAGSSLEVVWDEYIDHPGHFRISFDADGDDDFVDPPCLSGCNSRAPGIQLYSNEAVLLDGIPDTPGGGVGRARITLPDVECERCTLQVIQVMYDKPPYVLPGDDIYYQCADLVLRRSVSPTPAPTASQTPTATPTPTPPATPVPPPPTATSTRRPSPPPTPTRTPHAGGCDHEGTVTRSEILAAITMALAGATPTDPCVALLDTRPDGAITIDELVAAVTLGVRRAGAAVWG